MFKKFFDGGKAAAIRKSIEGKQKKAQKLLNKIKWLYDTVQIGESKREAIKLLHVQYTKRQRELMEEFVQKEIDIIEDKEGKYAYIEPVVGTYKDLEKLQLKDEKIICQSHALAGKSQDTGGKEE